MQKAGPDPDGEDRASKEGAATAFGIAVARITPDPPAILIRASGLPTSGVSPEISVGSFATMS